MSDNNEQMFSRSEVLQLLGRWALPPWTDHDGTELGGQVDCAALAEQIAASVDGWCHGCHAEREASGWTDALCGDHRESVSPDDDAQPDDLLYTAWGLIANAAGGDWDEADRLSPGWKAAAVRWRDAWHATFPVSEPES